MGISGYSNKRAVFLPAFMDSGDWKVVDAYKKHLLTKGITVKVEDDMPNYGIVRLGRVVGAMKKTNIEQLTQALFDSEKSHHLPRLRVCLGL